MFDSFPKTRPALPQSYQDIYNAHYKSNREGQTTASSLSQKMERWLHKKVAADLKGNNSSTLEIGAGTLNQLQYENTSPYDVVEPFGALYEKSPYLHKVRHVYKDISEVSTTEKYDRITAIATFEHITNLPEVVAQTCFLLKETGSLRISIPNEGNWLWKAGWMFTTGLEFRLRYKLDYGRLIKHEHVNTASEIEEVLRYFYKQISSHNFGVGKFLALYRFFECKNPDTDKAAAYINSLK